MNQENFSFQVFKNNKLRFAVKDTKSIEENDDEIIFRIKLNPEEEYAEWGKIQCRT